MIVEMYAPEKCRFFNCSELIASQCGTNNMITYHAIPTLISIVYLIQVAATESRRLV